MAEELLKIEHLTKKFEDNMILDDVSLTVHRGEVIVVVGPSGCGKSTMLRCINALEPIQGGTIEIDGQQISQKSKNLTELRQKVGMVFQSYELFPHLTVLNNILLAPTKVQKREKEEVKKEAMELLDRVGLKEKADSFPRQLSGGQKQRVAIAGVMAMHPRCIVLDEPTAMLDPHGRKSVIETVKKLNKEEGITVILITHYMEEVIEADHVFVMDDGNLVMDGTPREVFSQVEKLKELRLDVPQATLLAYELQKKGFPLRDGILSNEELVEELCQLKLKM